MNFTKTTSFLISITSLLLIISTSISSSSLETIKGSNFVIFKVYAQGNNTSGELLKDNKNTTNDSYYLIYEEKFQQQQKEIDKLQNQYNQLSNKTNYLDTVFDLIKQTDYTSKSDLGAEISKLQESIFNDIQTLYETISNQESQIQELWKFNNCVMSAANIGAQTDAYGFQEELLSCVG